MKVEISKKTDTELELIVLGKIVKLETEQYREEIFLLRAIQSSLEKNGHRVRIHFESSPTAVPPSEATGGLVAGQSESDSEIERMNRFSEKGRLTNWSE